MTSTPSLQRTPVAFFIFNRPEFTRRVFDVIAEARPPQLLVVGDGPRVGHEQDERLVREARAVMDRIDWPCDLRTCYSDVNLGCKLRITSGLDWVFTQADAAIVLEDDTLPDPSFFPYCEELLARYETDERVHMVSGFNALEPPPSIPYSYYFSRCYHVWGWATWARAWKHYDTEMRDWPALRQTRWLEDHLRGDAHARIARIIFDKTHAGGVPVWDFQWVFAGWRRNAVSVIPEINLVTNIGHGEAATNERNPNHPLANRPSSPLAFPLRHPPDVNVLERADNDEWQLVYPWYVPRGRRRLRLGMPSALRSHSGTRTRHD
jgi:hypothetical protein